MLYKLFQKAELSGLENLALARVEPFGLHLFELFFYIILGCLVLLALRSLLINLGMILLRPPKDAFLQGIMSDFVTAECASCRWKGQVPMIRKRCPKCGGTTFA